MAIAIIRNNGGWSPDIKWTDWDISGISGATRHVGDPDVYGWTYVITATQVSPKIQDNCYVTLSWGYINNNTGTLQVSDDNGDTWTTLDSQAVTSSGSFNVNLNNYVGKRLLFKFTCQITSGSWGYDLSVSTAAVKK